METSLQKANLAVDDVEASLELHQAEEEEHHIHMPGPSLWPLLLSLAILLAVVGMLFIPDAPWLTLVGTPLIILGIMGWVLEDPNSHGETFAAPVKIYQPSLSAHDALDQARAVAERIVVLGSTAYSAHPVKVELEEEVEGKGIILALYGKVELHAQREELEAALRELPNIVDVKNFLVAEDAILGTAYARIENMKAQGKLEGAQGISVLVENYILHIYGEVPKASMKASLERELLGIPGVRVIVNHIGLNKEIPGNLGRTINKVGV